MPSSPAIARISIILRGDLERTPETNCFTSPSKEKAEGKRFIMRVWERGEGRGGG